MLRILLSSMIAFTITVSPTWANLGQKEKAPLTQLLLTKLAEVEAKAFQAHVEKAFTEISQKNLLTYLKATGYPLTLQDEKALSRTEVSLAPNKDGNWEFKLSEVTLTFSLLDIYQKQVTINGKTLPIQGKTLTEVQAELEQQLLKKTTSLKSFWLKVFGVEDAHAGVIAGLVYTALIVFAIVGVRAAYAVISGQEKDTVEKLNQLSKSVEDEAKACENSVDDFDSYTATFEAASSIGSSSALSSKVSPSEMLKVALKDQLKSGKVSEDDCYSSVASAGEKLKLKMPDVNSQIFKNKKTKFEVLGDTRSPKDVPEALIRLCGPYNRLASCMNSFVEAHINNQDIGIFKDIAPEDHRRYRSRVRSTAQ
jgi:hypothetical protein